MVYFYNAMNMLASATNDLFGIVNLFVLFGFLQLSVHYVVEHHDVHAAHHTKQSHQ